MLVFSGRPGGVTAGHCSNSLILYELNCKDIIEMLCESSLLLTNQLLPAVYYFSYCRNLLAGFALD